MDVISMAYCSSDDEDTDTKPQDVSKLFTRKRPLSKTLSTAASSVVDSSTDRGYVSKRKPKPTSSDGEDNAVSTSNYSLLRDYFDSPINTHRIPPMRKGSLPRTTVFKSNFHQKPILSVHFHPHVACPLVLTSSLDGSLCVWDWYGRRGCVGLLHPHLQDPPSRTHPAAITDAHWLTETSAVSCGFDSKAALVDAVTGKTIRWFPHDSFVSALSLHPIDRQLFASGDYDRIVRCWDTRAGDRPAHTYAGAGGKILDLEFLNGGREIVATSDIVRRNATEQAIVVWEMSSQAVFSNQVYQEPYTCPALRPHPTEPTFLAQSNANYIALFSSKRTYKLNKYRRFEGHHVEGYPVQFDVSPDGGVVASGDSQGSIFYYKYHTGKLIESINLTHQRDPCVAVAFGPEEIGYLVTGTWSGDLFVLQ
jgi:WD40 repeat protein